MQIAEEHPRAGGYVSVRFAEFCWRCSKLQTIQKVLKRDGKGPVLTGAFSGMKRSSLRESCEVVWIWGTSGESDARPPLRYRKWISCRTHCLPTLPAEGQILSPAPPAFESSLESFPSQLSITNSTQGYPNSKPTMFVGVLR